MSLAVRDDVVKEGAYSHHFLCCGGQVARRLKCVKYEYAEEVRRTRLCARGAAPCVSQQTELRRVRKLPT
jgi:hypothetical protein